LSKSSISVEAIISCDERGQLVLPKDIRKKLSIQPGDKLAVLNCYSKDDKQFLTLIKANSLEELIKGYMGPVIKEIIQ